MWTGPQEYMTYELVSTSLAVSHMSGSTNFDSFRDGWWVAVEQLCGVLPPGLDQYCSQHSYVVAVKLFFSTSFVSVHVVHPYCSIDTTASLKKLHFISSVRSDFNMTDRLSIASHAFASRESMSVWVDGTLLPWEGKLSTSFRELSFCVAISTVWLKHIYSVFADKIFSKTFCLFLFLIFSVF